MSKHETTDFHRARDELYSHIQRCGVLEATPEQQDEWLEDTIEYVSERYPSLSRKEMSEVKELGKRYCRPVIPHGDHDSSDAWSEERTAEVEAAEAVEPTSVDAETLEPEAVEAVDAGDLEAGVGEGEEPAEEVEATAEAEPAEAAQQEAEAEEEAEEEAEAVKSSSE